jgi:hypothetical protein
MKTSYKKLRPVAFSLALISSGAMASDDTVFNLVHYQISFGHHSAEHNLYLASNARVSEEFTAHGYGGQFRVPLNSSNPRNWTLFNNDPGNEEKGAGLTLSEVAGLVLIVGLVGLSFYGIYGEYKTCRDEKSAGDCNTNFALTALR